MLCKNVVCVYYLWDLFPQTVCIYYAPSVDLIHRSMGQTHGWTRQRVAHRPMGDPSVDAGRAMQARGTSTDGSDPSVDRWLETWTHSKY